MCIGARRIGDYPGSAFPICLAAVSFTVFRRSAMIGSNDDQPLFAVVLLSSQHGLPNLSDTLIRSPDRIIKLRAVSKGVSHVVGEFKIYPGKVRRFCGDG